MSDELATDERCLRTASTVACLGLRAMPSLVVRKEKPQ